LKASGRMISRLTQENMAGYCGEEIDGTEVK